MADTRGRRIVLIGAGSVVFGPALIAAAMGRTELAGSTLVLLGHTPERHETISALAARMIAETGADLRLEGTLDPARAMEGADFVVSAIAVGGLGARKIDVELPMEYGIVQTKGDSFGPGGLARALRTIPPMLRIAEEMKRRCPDAWLLNYSNPLTPLCRAIQRTTGMKVVGLCDGVAQARTFVAEYLGVQPNRLTTKCAGVNHASWLTEIMLDGRDAYPLIWDRLERVGATAEPISFELLRVYGLYPSPADIHLAEFFPNYLGAASDGGKAWGLYPWPADQLIKARAADEDALRRRAQGLLALGPIPKSVGEVGMAMDVIAAMGEGGQMVFTADLPNDGQVPNLPRAVIVEMPAIAKGGTVRGLDAGELPKAIAAVDTARLAQQELMVDAALSGDRKIALQALLADPSTACLSVKQAREMLDRLLLAHKASLPRFA